ncbi:CNB_1a_G0057810.mRNA.1.CDS.1 [Saccharomyces cerevisiae]|nr:CNB_1a_G0057810.mRNA.1.CDS.1 [Saccharomyces cerevisiae]CAI7491233.1 CNB_1a_G0057810.mRNA.1.CDS.1 [Saccharomyces cerevisiae]
MDRKRSFEKLSFPSWSGKMYKNFQGGPIPSKYLIPKKKINLMVYTLFQVHTLKFNRKDYDTLSLLPQQRIL